MARRRRNLTEDEIKAIAMQRAEAAYQAAVARGMARFAREQARQEKRRQAARVCPKCDGTGQAPKPRIVRADNDTPAVKAAK